MDILWYNYDLSDMKDQIKATKQIQKVCRESLEYDEWQRRCKYKDSTDCPICGDNYHDNNSKCESHHHPKTLFTIVEEILDSHLEKNDLDNMTGIAIVQEVMDKHLLHQVHYINLCQHCHKKYHAGHPVVVEKMNEIFTKREQEGRDVEVVEKIDDVLVEEVVDIQVPPKTIIDVVPLVEPVPQILNVETSTDFISIDIDNLQKEIK